MDVVSRNNVTRMGAADGPTLLLAHGFGCDQHLWHPVAALLQNRFDIVLFDHVGSGNADPPEAWDPVKYSSCRVTPTTWWRLPRPSTCTT